MITKVNKQIIAVIQDVGNNNSIKAGNHATARPADCRPGNIMKAIKIVADNAVAIESALAAVNRNATRHTYTTAEEIIDLAERAESTLFYLLARKADMKGAVLAATSGVRPLPNSYKNSRTVTHVKMERRSTHWWLVEVESGTLFQSQCGGTHLTLTKEQDARAVEVLRKQCSIARV